MVRQLEEGLFQMRQTVVDSYLITDGRQAALVDSGFVGDMRLVETALSLAGLQWEAISSVLLTHGHLDHTLNLSALVERSGATVYMHPDDWDHLVGRYRYRGWSRVCGALEWAGRAAFGYLPVGGFEPIGDGDVLDVLGGIQVVHTPGHTAGHCCYLWRERRLLFAGDLFACVLPGARLPPRIFNSCPERFPASLAKVRRLALRGMLSNHCDRSGSELQLERFNRRFHSYGP